MEQQIIALDYDGSYTKFPELFDMIIDKGILDGHKVIMATMRKPEENTPILDKLKEKIEVYYTSREAKVSYLRDNHSIYPDLWIDDNPHWIYNDSN